MKTILALFLFILLAVGCMEDKNDYNYTLINELKRIENFQENYDLYIGEEITITPKVVLSIDSVQPDLSYEWYLDTVLVSREPSYTFKAEKAGFFYLTFCPVDNKNGNKFTERAYVDVTSVWTNGWLILSDNGGNSELSIVKSRYLSVDGIDTLTYVKEPDLNIYPGLGRGPQQLAEHRMNDDSKTIPAEVVVLQKEKAIELNGISLEREIYTEEEFLDEVPANFNPVQAVMTYKSNFLLNEDGKIYHSVSSDWQAFHTGRYLSEPLFSGKKFIDIRETFFGKGDFVLGLYPNEDGTVSFAGFADASNKTESLGGLAEMSNLGDIEDLTNYVNVSDEILYYGWSTGDEYISIRRNKTTNAYTLVNTEFYLSSSWVSGVRNFRLEVYKDDVKELDPQTFSDFKSLATFPFREYCVAACGNTLNLVWYQEKKPHVFPIKSFGSPIVKIVSKDFYDKYEEHIGEGPHLGVALQSGEFYVFAIDEDYPEQSEQLFYYAGFGQIKDIMYKYASYISAYDGVY